MADLLKFDRTSFRIVSFADKGQNVEYWLNKSVYERLCASWYLTCASYNLPYSADYKVDRTVFRIRKFGSE
ncbi:MAG: hypothetical protein IPM42_10175 [Saprospiraceae bacterium]|nr:hypothetical protein [Saprospiraceae bacterium]